MQITEGKRIGRFAPTPSGPLHSGSLVTAVASYCHSRSIKGQWLLRIEDLDTPRVVKGSADNIIHTLEAFGFEWDGEVIFQSQRFELYDEYLQHLISQGVVYGCNCSRKKLLKEEHQIGPLGSIYPGYCRHKKLALNSFKLRLNIETADNIAFTDQLFGPIKLDLQKDSGDFILKRLDGIYAYHLAVIIDDFLQQVTDIVRGADLLESSCLHIHLNQLLGFSNADYLHIPLIKNDVGDKLSKQTGAKSLSIKKASTELLNSLIFLGQDAPAELADYKPADILAYAITHWDVSKIPCEIARL